MRLVVLSLPLLPVLGLGPVWAAGSRYHLEVAGRISMEAPTGQGLHRVACCPDGAWVALHSSGWVHLIDREGKTRFHQAHAPEFLHTTACACDGDGQLWVGAAGEVRRFELTESGEPRLVQTFRVDGGISDLLVLGDQFYVLGLMFLENRHVLLRRFRKADGAFLGAIPVEAGSRPWRKADELGRGVDALLSGGKLLPAARGWSHLPVNPLEFRLYSSDGRPLGIFRPLLRRFRNVSFDELRSSGRPPLHEIDYVMGAVRLPDGRIVVQIARGFSQEAPPADGEAPTYLVVFDEKLEPLAEEVPIDPASAVGVLVGGDREGRLCFAHFATDGPATLLKARLEERELARLAGR